jgi:hypothetical protein
LLDVNLATEDGVMFGHARAPPDIKILQKCGRVVQQKATCSIHYKMLILNDLSGYQTLSWTILSPLRLPVPPSRRYPSLPHPAVTANFRLP